MEFKKITIDDVDFDNIEKVIVYWIHKVAEYSLNDNQNVFFIREMMKVYQNHLTTDGKVVMFGNKIKAVYKEKSATRTDLHISAF